MTASLRIDRSGPFTLSLAFDGPLELAAALASVVARFEAGLPVSEPVAAPSSSPTVVDEDEARRERARRKKAAQRAAAKRGTGGDMSPVVPGTDGDMSRGLSPGQVPARPLSLIADSSGFSLTSESENEKKNEKKRERHASAAGHVPGTVPGTVSPGHLPPLALDDPPSEAMVQLARGIALARAPGRPVPDIAREWAKFVAHIADLRERGEAAHASEPKWRQWFLRAIEYADRGPSGARRRHDIVQRGPSSGGPKLDFNDPDAEFPFPEPRGA